jgi:hypothetical protein
MPAGVAQPVPPVSAERIRDHDAAIVLAVVEVLAQHVLTTHGAGGFNDRGVPVRESWNRSGRPENDPGLCQ